MKGSKAAKGFYISVAVLGLAIIASAFAYKREAAKTKDLKKRVEDAYNELGGIRNGTPTEEHKRSLQQQRVVIEEKYQAIIREAMLWNVTPTENMPVEDFLGKMYTTIGTVLTSAEAKQILIAARAKNLGFDDLVEVPPTPDDDIVQLQRELSAATDIAQLLIASDVYSIDIMARREDALMEEGQSGPTTGRIATDAAASRRRRRPKVDLYDTVPFRVRFTCKYPSLAAFQKSLITQEKTRVQEAGRWELRPKNFLVVNDLWYKVRDIDKDTAELLRSTASSPTAQAYRGIIPDDLPGALNMLNRDRQAALRFFQLWRTFSPEQKKIYSIKNRLGEQISNTEKERLEQELKRAERELEQRTLLQGRGRPPGYNLIEVTMLIDLIQFNQTMLAEVKPEKPAPEPTASSPTASK
jgi:hypothetical protein